MRRGPLGRERLLGELGERFRDVRQAPDGVCRPGAMRINGVQCRGTLICLKALYGANGVMASIDDL